MLNENNRQKNFSRAALKQHMEEIKLSDADKELKDQGLLVELFHELVWTVRA